MVRLNAFPRGRSTRVPASPSRSSWWSEVARDFTGGRLDELERDVLPLIGEEVAPLLRPQLRARHLAVVVLLEALPSDDPAAAEAAFGILVAGVSASDDDGDVPFTIGLQRIESASLASSFAHRWWHRLAIAHCDDTPRSGIAFTTAAYAVAACEGLAQVQSERSERDVLVWLNTAARHIEIEHGDGVDLALVLRAARLLQPLLERASLAPPST
jgi:hypothetical protein